MELFFVHKLACGKRARERELATTLNEKPTDNGIAEPYAR